ILFPVLVSTGSVIMKLDPVEISDDINATIDAGTKAIMSKGEVVITKSATKTVDEIKEELKEKN
ncbi:MAG: CvpA family protein, partial [Campylobacterota bacterium]